jgi:hypothetical protein
MAELTRTDWASGETPVLATVLNNIGLDIRTAGANRDMAGYALINVSALTRAGANAMTFSTNGTERVRIASDGKVGIGTATPQIKLEVVGQAASPSLTYGTGDLSLVRTTTGAQLGVNSLNGAPWGMWLQAKDLVGGALGIYLNPLGGNVGVGTSDPKSKLHVVGLPQYANNAAAIAGGLTAGAFYRTGGDPDAVCVVH